MNRRRIQPLAGLLSLVALVMLGGVVAAQPTIDPSLQGRLLQRSDGALFVYKDGVRYPVLPAELSDERINAIPEAGLLVERLGDLFALVGSPGPASGAPLATTGSSSGGASAATYPPIADAALTTSPAVTGALAALVGQTLLACDLVGVPAEATVERAETTTGTDGRLHVLLVLLATNLGQERAHTPLPIQLRDERGRLFDRTSTGLDPDLPTLARQYGLSPTPSTTLEPGVSDRQLLAFIIAPDVQTLTLTTNTLSRCRGSGAR